MARELFRINPALNQPALAAAFARDGVVQVRDVLTAEAASNILDVLTRDTPWGLAWQAGTQPPASLRGADVARLAPAERQKIASRIDTAMRSGDYAFQFAQYPMLEAYLGRWNPGSPHELLLEHLNDAPFLDLVRAITAIPELIKADAQATFYAPGHFLAQHDDSHVGQGWRVAYVLNVCGAEWRADWGGYLQFFDEAGDVMRAYRPRFNALNLFLVPRRHAVSMVAPFAPNARFAITGWLRDR